MSALVSSICRTAGSTGYRQCRVSLISRLFSTSGQAPLSAGPVRLQLSANYKPKVKMADIPEKKTRVQTELEAFDEIFPSLVDDLTKQGLKDDQISSAMAWFKKVAEFNVPYGKKNRGLTVVQSYRYLKGDEATEDEIRIARIIGWCIEFLQGYFLVADDIMDQSETRRGRPCWYKMPNIGMEAINDSFFLECAIYVLLKKHCRSKPYYMDIVDLFHETTLQTVTGQCLDMLAATGDKVDFTRYTLNNHNAIVKWKTAFYSFYLPVASAMYMAGIDDEESHANAKAILLQMGEYFQIQDDYLDCYGDPAVTGKVGTDIEDNKCSWLIVQALQRATPEQKKFLEENYGQHDAEKVQSVKKLFNELNLEKVYRDYEDRSYEELSSLVSKLSKNLPSEMFVAFAKKIYKRNK